MRRRFLSSFPVPGKLCLCMVASFLTAEMMKAIELPYKCEMAPKITAAYDSETGKWYERVSDGADHDD